MKKTILIFGGLSVAILGLFQLEKWSLFSLGSSKSFSFAILGAAFLLVGTLIGRFLLVKSEARKKALKKSSLSDQEVRVLERIALGHSNKEIAEELFIAESTVKSHVSNILSKLQARRRTDAVRIALDLGILVP